MRGLIAKQLLLLFMLSLTFFSNASFSAPILYDLNANWSDSQNPNGPWSYNDGGGPITNHVVNYIPGVFTAPQPAWVHAASGPGHIVSWFKATSSYSDWLSGDVITHTWDVASSGGLSTPNSNVSWTSPMNGTIDIGGSVWLARNIGRAVNWNLLINGAITTGGSLFDGDAFSRVTPFALSAGSGGSSVLNNVSVLAGDEVTLSFITTSRYGEFTGVNLDIELTPDPTIPEPTTLALVGLGLAGIGWKRRKAA